MSSAAADASVRAARRQLYRLPRAQYSVTIAGGSWHRPMNCGGQTMACLERSWCSRTARSRRAGCMHTTGSQLTTLCMLAHHNSKGRHQQQQQQQRRGSKQQNWAPHKRHGQSRQLGCIARHSQIYHGIPPHLNDVWMAHSYHYAGFLMKCTHQLIRQLQPAAVRDPVCRAQRVVKSNPFSTCMYAAAHLREAVCDPTSQPAALPVQHKSLARALFNSAVQ